MTESRQNWAGNFTYSAARLHYPRTVEQVQALVLRADTVKALGSRHSFNHIADTSEDLISLERLDRLVEIDRERQTVTVDAGLRYGQLGAHLQREGYALHNLASLPHISVAGSCATATHGSGDRNGNLATSVTALELVTADGDVVTLSRARHGDRFHGAVVGLGGLGVVTRLTLDIQPTFEVRQDVYENLPFEVLDDHFDDITGSAYSVSLFTRWRDSRINQVWLKRRVVDDGPALPEPEFFGATLAPAKRHPIDDMPAQNATAQGIAGPWHERLPHFRMEFTPSNGEELQTEYLIPRHHAVVALQAIDRLREQIAPLLQVSEVRTIAADDLWMSPCFDQPCMGIHFTWIKDWPAVNRLLPSIEAELAPFDARPHWGKLFTTAPERFPKLFPKLPDFQQLLLDYDPRGKFRNRFLDTLIFG